MTRLVRSRKLTISQFHAKNLVVAQILVSPPNETSEDRLVGAELCERVEGTPLHIPRLEKDRGCMVVDGVGGLSCVRLTK